MENYFELNLPDTILASSPLFVIGTGRCGTKTLSRLLETNDKCFIIHEAFPYLLEEVTDFLSGRMTESNFLRILKETRNFDTTGEKKIVGESNQRLSFILPLLNKAFPHSKFIWLIRDGRTNVSSMHYRCWYLNIPLSKMFIRWNQNRITPYLVKDYNVPGWKNFSSFEKCCWYWNMTNKIIHQDIKNFNINALLIKLEDIDNNTDAIFKFLNIYEDNSNITNSAPITNTAQVFRKRMFLYPHKPLPYKFWSRKQKKIFLRHCSDLMNTYYPGWLNDYDKERLPDFCYGAIYRFIWVVRRNISIFLLRVLHIGFVQSAIKYISYTKSYKKLMSLSADIRSKAGFTDILRYYH